MSALEVFPALLDHTKVQTIRPAWKENKSLKPIADAATKNVIRKFSKTGRIAFIEETSPRFAVGEQVQIMWHQRTSPKGSWFCNKCGSEIAASHERDSKPDGTIWCISCNAPRNDDIFPKILGTVEITEVFQIEMWCGNDVPLISGYSLKKSEEFAKMDGFKIYRDFFDWFNSHYDLSAPKKFWVYRYMWLP